MNLFLYASLLLCGVRSVAASCAHGTYLYRRDSSGGEEVKVSDFGYGTFDGPINWHGLSKENELCATGTQQSPINVDQTIQVVKAGTVKANIPVQEDVAFENLGSTVEVILNGKTVIGNQTFTLQQFHFHTPSEHRISNEHFPVEIHFVHEATDNREQLAVIAMIVQLESNVTTAPLDTVISHVEKIKTPGNATTVSSLDMTPVVDAINQMPFYTYTGSLTTPPCAEGITFMVSTQALPLQVDMYNRLKAVMGFNSRHIQNKDGQPNILAVSARNMPRHKPDQSERSGYRNGTRGRGRYRW